MKIQLLSDVMGGRLQSVEEDGVIESAGGWCDRKKGVNYELSRNE
jgi:hypothetical protein